MRSTESDSRSDCHEIVEAGERAVEVGDDGIAERARHVGPSSRGKRSSSSPGTST